MSKRAFDFAACLVALPFAVPLCLVLMILIRLESRGSPIFVQHRIGLGRKPFRMLKLRTMAAGTAEVASHHVEPGRITRVGRILRKLKLDELPQLLNVLTGSMSLVGPRPCLASQTELIDARESRGVFKYRPGITGPAQLMGVDMSQPTRLAEIEAEYFSRSNPWRDLKLILATSLGQGIGDAVPHYRDN